MAAGYLMITYASLEFVMEDTSRGHLSMLFPCNLDVKSVWMVNKTLSSRASGDSLSDYRVCRPGRSLGSSREIVAVTDPTALLERSYAGDVPGGFRHAAVSQRNGIRFGVDPNSVNEPSSLGRFTWAVSTLSY